MMPDLIDTFPSGESAETSKCLLIEVVTVWIRHDKMALFSVYVKQRIECLVSDTSLRAISHDLLWGTIGITHLLFLCQLHGATVVEPECEIRILLVLILGHLQLFDQAVAVDLAEHMWLRPMHPCAANVPFLAIEVGTEGPPSHAITRLDD